MEQGRSGSHRLEKLLLLVAPLAITVGVLSAVADPARSYELSIYESNPVFWGSLVVAGTISIWGLFSANRSTRWISAGLLPSIPFLAVSFPLIHGYYFLGHGDALTHLGRLRTLSSGELALWELFYFLAASLTMMVDPFLSGPIRQSMLFVPSLFALLFVISIPLLVREVTDVPRAPKIAFAISAGLPVIDSYAAHIDFHPFSFGILFIPFGFFVAYRAQANPSRRWMFLLLGLFCAVLFLHPIQFLLFWGGLIAFGLSNRLILNTRAEATKQITIWPVLVAAGVLLWLRVENKRHFEDYVVLTFGIVERITLAGSWLSEKTESAAGSGFNIIEIVISLYGLSIVLGLGATILVLATLSRVVTNGWTDEARRRLQMASLFIPVLGLGAVAFAGGVGDVTYRLIGSAVVGGIIGSAIGLGIFYEKMKPRGIARATGIAVLSVIFVVGIMTVFMSPHILYGSQHFDKSMNSGYETMFKYENPDIEYEGLDPPPFRVRDAQQGVEVFNALQGQQPPSHFADQRLAEHYHDPRYLTISSSGRQERLEVLGGYRYTEDDFLYLDSSSDISKIQSTGGLTVYRVDGLNQTDPN